MNALRLRGRVQVRAWKRGRVLWELERDNLVVNAAMAPVANLSGGTVANQSVGAIGFGSGIAAAALTDTQLTAPAYYKAIGAATYPAAGQVQFAWTLVGATDAGAIGINIQELGLFANTGVIALPLYEAAAAPAMTLYARILLGLGAFSAGLNFSGSWTIVAS